MKRSFSRCLIALALAAVPALPGTAAAQSCDASQFDCGTDTYEPEGLTLVWPDLPDPDDSITAPALTLRFDNTRDETVDIDIRVLADNGNGKRKTKRFRVKGITAGRSEVLTIPVADLGVDTADMRFAGQLQASARITSDSLCAGGACKKPRTTRTAATPRARADEPLGPGPILVATNAVYFHPSDTPGAFELYGRDVLMDRYAGGDLAGVANAEADVEMLRVSDGGKFAEHKSKHLTEMAAADYDADNASGAPLPPLGPTSFASNLLGLCVKWEIQTVDHGKKIETSSGNEITEDYWNAQPKGGINGIKAAGTNGSGQMVVTARGVVVIVRKGNDVQILPTHHQTGCVAFAGDPGQYEVTVLTLHKDNRGNTMFYGTGLLPFGFKELVQLKTAKTAVISVGDFSAEATLAAVSGFSMYRTTFGVTNKTMRIRNVNTCGEDDLGNPNNDGGANSSAHFDDSGLPSGIAYVRIHDGTRPGCSGSDHRRFKFIVTHEIGHAWQLLNQEREEPDASHSLEDLAEDVCTPTEPGYTIDTLEHSAIGAREGMAHFYATVVWNSPASSDAVFTWFGNPEDPEASDSAQHGGRLFNVCSTPAKCGKSTVRDWLRHYWDWHTPWAPGSKPHPFATTQAYGNAMNDDGTDRGNYYQKLYEAVQASGALAPFADEWVESAELNGVVTSPSGPGCNLPSYPGCDASDPFDAQGSPGCPCADVQETTSELDLADDGYYPDGTASYDVHGRNGTGQYCIDFSTSQNVEAVCNRRASDSAPECMECGVDTMTACACENDAECQSLGDSELECWGGDDQGWPGSARGRCMPNANSPQNREALSDSPWICLESCGSRGGGDPDRFVCLYDQREPNIHMTHAQCVDVAGCTAPEGYCEQSGALCDTEEICAIDFDDCCVPECTQTSDCPTWGFPNTYVCDNDGPGLPGFCVPAGCEFPMADQEFCGMFR